MPLLNKEKQRWLEKAVSEYIQGNLSFVTFRVDDKAKRLEWERKIISTLSCCEECHQSPNWLGMHSPKQRIRDSGLWLVNGLYKEPLSEKELEDLERIVQAG